ncbi:MAG: putative metal-binding motif-containing protein [Polyangiaceae bacterium]
MSNFRVVRGFALAGALWLSACGARSELNFAPGSNGSGGAPPVACSNDTDCEPPNACGSFRCLERKCQFEAVSCDDNSPCTEDSCDPTLGCRHRFLSLDMDGDKHRSPRPGFAAGTDVCGDDCDDTNPNTFPTNTEQCDGVDNDCDGVVDNGFGYRRTPQEPVRVSPLTAQRAQRDEGGIVGTPKAFVVSYNALEDRSRSHLKGLTSSGAVLFDTLVSEPNTNTFAGSLAWSGQEIATAWGDARQGSNYEIYARAFSADGQKLREVTRLTDAEGFSLHPNIKWNQSEYLVVFDDRRAAGLGDNAQLFAQRLAPDGSLLGDNTLLVSGPGTSETPSVALSPRRVGVAYSSIQAPDTHSHLGFRVFDAALNAMGASAQVGDDVDTYTVQFVKDRFIALWDVSDSMMQGDAILGCGLRRVGRALGQAPQGDRFGPFRAQRGGPFARRSLVDDVG